MNEMDDKNREDSMCCKNIHDISLHGVVKNVCI